MKEDATVRWVAHYPAGDAPTCDYAAKAPSLDAAKRKRAAVINAPLWTLR